MTILTPDMKAKCLTMANIPRLLLVCKPLHIINYAVLPKLMPNIAGKTFHAAMYCWYFSIFHEVLPLLFVTSSQDDGVDVP